MSYTMYTPLNVWLDPASMTDVVAYIQTYLRDNPIYSTTEIETLIHDYLIAHPELIGGVQSVNGKTGTVVLSASDINTENNVTIESVLASLSSQISTIAANVATNTNNITSLTGRVSTAETDISNLKSNFELVEKAQPGNLLDGVSWEAGSIDGATGATMASNTRLRTTDYIDLLENSVISFSIESGYKYVIDWFDENGSPVIINNHAVWQTGDSSYSSFGTATKIKLLIADTSDGNVDLSYASKLTATVSFAIVTDFNNISNTLTLTTDKYDFGFVLGTLNPGTGIESTSTTRIRSDYIRLGIGSVITTSSTNQNTLIVYEYDADKTYKSDSVWEAGNRYIVKNDGFVRILLRKNSSNATISPSEIETISGMLSVLRVIPQEIIQKVASDVSIKDVEAFALRKYTNNARHIPSNSATPLTILHFSDLHGDVSALTRIINDADAIGVQIDEKICTGDIVANTYAQITSWWDKYVLTCIGNHDSASYSAQSGYNWTALSMANRDAYYIAPFESNWGITHTSGTSYYYKDYATQKIRLIVLDVMLYTDNGEDATTQTSWLESLLADAITNNLHVLIAIHAPHGGATAKECSFSRFGQTTMPTDSDCNTPQSVIDAVSTKIEGGLKFIGYLVGHTHQDNIWDVENDSKQLMYCITCATTEQIQWKNSDQYRGEDADAFNLVTIDTANTLVKIVRGGGVNVDDHMRTRKAICFNYSTGAIVGEVL